MLPTNTDKMKPTERKEQLRKKFEDFLKPAPAQFHSLHRSDVFDFFWKEIESRDRLLEAAHNVIVNANYETVGSVAFGELVNKYHALKLEQKQQSKT